MEYQHGLIASRSHRRRMRRMASLVWPVAVLFLFTFFCLFVGAVASKHLNITEALAAWLIYKILFISILVLASFLHANLQRKTIASLTFLEQQREAQSAICFLDHISSASDTRIRLAKNRSLQTLPLHTLGDNEEVSRRYWKTLYLGLMLLRALRQTNPSVTESSRQLIQPDSMPNDISQLALLPPGESADHEKYFIPTGHS